MRIAAIAFRLFEAALMYGNAHLTFVAYGEARLGEVACHITEGGKARRLDCFCQRDSTFVVDSTRNPRKRESE